MPQLQLPIFPFGSTAITNEIAFERRENQITYFNGHLPVFTHEVADVGSFRLYTTQLIENGITSQAQISRVFGVPAVTVKRSVKKYRKGGAKVFFAPPHKRQGYRLTPERLANAQSLLDAGQSVPSISVELGVLATTLHKAIDDGRLRQPEKKKR